jgi:nucleoredoxin
MAKGFALFMIGLVLLLGIYASWDTLSSVWGIAQTGQAMIAPTAPKPEPSAKPVHLVGLGETFSKSLLILDGGQPHAFDGNKLSGVTYYAFYYSASWCPPCRAFTPELVNFYNAFKPKHPNFELIFVDLDHSEGDMINYMVGDNMPWPAVWYTQINSPDLPAMKYCGPGIPCLVLTDVMGNVLADSFQGGDYVGPQSVMNQIPQIVRD